MKKRSIFLSPFLLLVASTTVGAQYVGSYSGAWGTTWNNPTSSLASVMIQGHINKKMLERSVAAREGRGRAGTPSRSKSRNTSSSPVARPPAAVPSYSVLGFKPVANSGVVKQTADAIGRNAQERAALLTIFQEVKKSYEAEVAKEGMSNDIAAALTFFMVSVSMVYHQTEEPPENVTNALVEVLRQELSPSPDFKRMTDLEKQKMHDWLVVSGGFLLAGYVDAVQKSDQEQLGDYKELANAFFKIVFGTGAEKFNLAAVASAPAIESPVAGNVDSPMPAYSTSMLAADLVSEFESNEVRANQLYLGKVVRIRGNVNASEAASGGRVILTFNRTALTYTNARCLFDKSQGALVASINSNDEVTVEGTVKGMGGGALGIKAFLVLENCTVQ